MRRGRESQQHLEEGASDSSSCTSGEVGYQGIEAGAAVVDGVAAAAGTGVGGAPGRGTAGASSLRRRRRLAVGVVSWLFGRRRRFSLP